MKSILLVMATFVSAQAFAGALMKCDGLIQAPSGKKMKIMQSHLEMRPTSDEKNLLVNLTVDGSKVFDAYLTPLKKNSAEEISFELIDGTTRTYAVSLKSTDQKVKGSEDQSYSTLSIKAKLDKTVETAQGITACSISKE